MLDLAVAFVLGAAFNAVVQSLANDVIMAGVAGLVGLDMVSQLAVGPLLYGRFIAALLSFLIIASVLFVLIKAAARFNKPPAEQPSVPETDEVGLLREIRDLLTAQASGSSGAHG